MDPSTAHFTLALLVAAQEARAQDAPEPSAQGQESLEQALEDLRREHAREIAELREELYELEDEVSANARSQTPAQESLGLFNPALTVFGNFLYRHDDRPVYVDDDPTAERVDDRFSLREVELDLRAPIDPWADGVLVATFEAETPGDYEAFVEEGYVVLKKLPLLDAAPAGLKLKLGRFRPSFGRFNTIHLHDLPQVTYPRALRTFLGAEGFVADGVSGQFFLPSPSDADVLDATVQLVDGGNVAVAPDGDSSDLAAIGRVKWFRDLAPGQDVEVGASTWTSDLDSRLYGLDATYRWKPHAAGEWNSFLLGAELFQADLDDGAHDDHPAGLDLWSQVQLDRNVYVGARYGRAEDLFDERLDTSSAGVFLTYYTTEFLRFRLGVEHAESDLAELDDVDTVFLEMNFVYGSHPAEPYWVNR